MQKYTALILSVTLMLVLVYAAQAAMLGDRLVENPQKTLDSIEYGVERSRDNHSHRYYDDMLDVVKYFTENMFSEADDEYKNAVINFLKSPRSMNALCDALCDEAQTYLVKKPFLKAVLQDYYAKLMEMYIIAGDRESRETVDAFLQWERLIMKEKNVSQAMYQLEYRWASYFSTKNRPLAVDDINLTYLSYNLFKDEEYVIWGDLFKKFDSVLE